FGCQSADSACAASSNKREREVFILRSGCRESEILPGVWNADQARAFNVQRLRFSTRSADEILSRMRREDAAHRLERRQIVLKSERRRRLAQSASLLRLRLLAAWRCGQSLS